MIKIENLVFSRGTHKILDINKLYIPRLQHLFIEGPSGSGKSTLLNLIAGVLSADEGQITILNKKLSTLSNSDKDRFRSEHIGFIFQQFNLIPYLSVIENVTLPCNFSSQRKKKAKQCTGSLQKEAVRLLSALGLKDNELLTRSVNELSVGQQQRVAAARAMIGSPEIIIADEPTSALDANHKQAFMKMLFDECEKENITLIFVSHDTSLRHLFNTSINLAKLNNITYEKVV